MNELVVVMTIAGRSAAIPAAEVQSVVELEAIVAIPRAPGYVLGLAALRSSTLTVIDTAAAIGLAAGGPPPPGARVAIVDHAGHRYGLVLEAIEDVAEVQSDPVAVPGEAGPGWQRVSHGLVETDRGPALLLSVERLLAGPPALAA